MSNSFKQEMDWYSYWHQTTQDYHYITGQLKLTVVWSMQLTMTPVLRYSILELRYTFFYKKTIILPEPQFS